MTQLTPANARLVEQQREMDPKPNLVYRRLHFPDGVPREYAWTGPDPALQQYGGIGIQRLQYDEWAEMSRTEEEKGDGHIGPANIGNMPRPKAHGGCECPACISAQRRMLGE